MTDQYIQSCALCGQNTAETKDHIPPRNIFKKPRPKNLITVPSCKICNEGASKDDEYFLHFLTTSISPQEYPDIEDLLKNKTLRALKRSEAKRYRQYFFDSFSYKDVYSLHGKYLGKAPIRRIEANRVLSVVERIGRGLYYHEKGVSIPKNGSIEVMMINPENPLNDLQKEAGFFAPKKFGNDAFEYSSIIPHDCEVSEGFYIKFYNVISFYINVIKLT